MGLATRVGRRIVPSLLSDTLVSVRLHRQVHGELPNLLFPKTFSEKVLVRKLFDGNPLLKQFADKYAVRSYVEGRLGPDVLPRLHFVTREPAEIPFDSLPDRFVVKPTHGCGWIEIVRDKARLDRDRLIETCRGWLRQNYYSRWRERVYREIEPRILVEELIDDDSGGAPLDYKLYVFHGRVETIEVISGRFSAIQVSNHDREWRRQEFQIAYEQSPVETPAPRHLERLIEAAETLGRGIDFVRADFYHLPDRIVFGELTTTPGAGLEVFRPRSYDRRFGDLW